MPSTLTMLLAVVLFLLGVRLSAFFSGAETGFYRLSFVRLSIDAQAGGRVARKLMWFARNPAYFVATTLVGNNVANYLTTAAIGLGAGLLWNSQSGWAEIGGTLLLSPVVFVFGELVPKYLYYRAPLTLLTRDLPWFTGFYYLFLGVSFPLVGITKILERIGRSESRPLDLVLGRTRLVQVLGHGRREGLLTDLQSRLVNGLMSAAVQPVTDAMTPARRVLGVTDQAAREEVLENARRYGLSNVPVRRAEHPESWYAYLRVVDVTISHRPLPSLMRTMPRIEASRTKLEALLTLRESRETHGAVVQGESVVGIVTERGLVEQLFRPPAAAGTRLAAAS